MRSTRLHLFIILLICLFCPAATAGPFADVHTHYKWSQEDVTTPRQAVDILRQNGIGLAVVMGVPSDHALRLKALAPNMIIAFWSPYQRPSDWSSWAFNPTTLHRARNALESGKYQGIGELHLIGGFAPGADSPVIQGLLRLADEYNVPVMLHTEMSRPAFMLDICAAHPGIDIIWAHAGAILSPAQVRQVLDRCPRVWAEFSARDPWRFVGNPIVDGQHRLLPDWRRLILDHADRVLVGSDPVWPVEQLDAWDQPDMGWQEYSRFIDFHRRWTATLPEPVVERIGWTNALRLFGKDRHTGRQPGFSGTRPLR